MEECYDIFPPKFIEDAIILLHVDVLIIYISFLGHSALLCKIKHKFQMEYILNCVKIVNESLKDQITCSTNAEKR